MKTIAAVVFALSAALGADLSLPSNAFERHGMIAATFRTNSLATGTGVLSIRWTDALGRVVVDRKLLVILTDESTISFQIDMTRAAAMRNQLRVHFTFDGKNRKGAADHRAEDAHVNLSPNSRI